MPETRCQTSRRSAVRLASGICLLASSVGCYSYSQIEPAAAPPGSEVRARLTGAASDRVAPIIGSFDRVLVGNVAENSAGSLVLQVPMGAMPNVTADVVRMQTRVPVMPGDLVSLERRRLDRTRTALLVGAITLGVAGGVSAALRAGGGAEQGRQPEDPPPINLIPLVRFRF